MYILKTSYLNVMMKASDPQEELRKSGRWQRTKEKGETAWKGKREREGERKEGAERKRKERKWNEEKIQGNNCFSIFLHVSIGVLALCTNDSA